LKGETTFFGAEEIIAAVALKKSEKKRHTG